MKCFNIRGKYVPASSILFFSHGTQGHWFDLWTVTLTNGTTLEIQTGADTAQYKAANELLAEIKEYFGIK